MIIGLGSDLCNIERIQNSLDRFGERFEQRVFTESSAPRRQGARSPRRHAGQALRRQGGLFQGGRHRLQGRRVHEGHRRGQRAVGAHRRWR